jgi:hypothetical protein
MDVQTKGIVVYGVHSMSFLSLFIFNDSVIHNDPPK